MDFNVSVGDDNQDIRILAPWFLNCLNRLSGSNPAKFILKQQVFAQTPMNGFKADPEKYQKYVELKGKSDYTRVVEPIIDFLERNRFIRILMLIQQKLQLQELVLINATNLQT
jgi:hypothetical protein